MKLRIVLGVIVVAAVVYCSLPYYARQALIHWMPVIDDLETFHRHTVRHDPDRVWNWPLSADYNRCQLPEPDVYYLDSLHTVAFLVIRHDSLLFETYRDGWNDTLTSNIYSATKTIVGMLAGIALDEGKIQSLDDPVSRYIPSYRKGMQADVTIRHLLTMSGGMAWDEAYSSLFSVTTHGYYGNDLYKLVTGLEVCDRPGVQYSYRSGETQLLAFVIEAATGKTLSQYAEEKLWKPMQAERDAYWLLDKQDGDEKAFCCFHTTARDVARFARLMLHRGNWNGRQLVSQAYMDEMMRPASWLKDQWGKDSLNYYGYQTWIMHYHDQVNPYMRGMLGQYIIAIPSQDAIVVRLGRKRCDLYDREITTDITRYMDMAMRILQD
ncbi:serine hydrolase [Phocaeicola coprophilus]|jgi:CubicO group peptidase (beta-lactamase class C family)|uniref:serine hydrolase domain-containing protein n=1 Tax=Phocaeicola coprophilus TaxID=387090 RepID=UPI002942C533|nr:serine hydrolase [Phocaeicola coprophilus]